MSFDATDHREIGARRELLIDDWLIARCDNLERRLHHPVPADIALTFDEHWEGPDCCYVTVFHDRDRYRMYYSCYPMREFSGSNQYVGYAEIDDGITWQKTTLGLIDFQGSRENNLIISGTDAHTFAPFIDTNPRAADGSNYKAIAGNPPHPMASDDSIYWRIRYARCRPVCHPFLSLIVIGANHAVCPLTLAL